MKLFFSIFALSICGFISGGTISIYAQDTEINHRGFKADFSQIKDLPEKDTIIKAFKRQIEIVEKVKLSEDDRRFFKSVPIVMLSANSTRYCV